MTTVSQYHRGTTRKQTPNHRYGVIIARWPHVSRIHDHAQFGGGGERHPEAEG